MTLQPDAPAPKARTAWLADTNSCLNMMSILVCVRLTSHVQAEGLTSPGRFHNLSAVYYNKANKGHIEPSTPGRWHRGLSSPGKLRLISVPDCKRYAQSYAPDRRCRVARGLPSPGWVHPSCYSRGTHRHAMRRSEIGTTAMLLTLDCGPILRAQALIRLDFEYRPRQRKTAPATACSIIIHAVQHLCSGHINTCVRSYARGHSSGDRTSPVLRICRHARSLRASVLPPARANRLSSLQQKGQPRWLAATDHVARQRQRYQPRKPAAREHRHWGHHQAPQVRMPAPLHRTHLCMQGRHRHRSCQCQDQWVGREVPGLQLVLLHPHLLGIMCQYHPCRWRTGHRYQPRRTRQYPGSRDKLAMVFRHQPWSTACINRLAIGPTVCELALPEADHLRGGAQVQGPGPEHSISAGIIHLSTPLVTGQRSSTAEGPSSLEASIRQRRSASENSSGGAMTIQEVEGSECGRMARLAKLSCTMGYDSLPKRSTASQNGTVGRDDTRGHKQPQAHSRDTCHCPDRKNLHGAVSLVASAWRISKSIMPTCERVAQLHPQFAYLGSPVSTVDYIRAVYTTVLPGCSPDAGRRDQANVAVSPPVWRACSAVEGCPLEGTWMTSVTGREATISPSNPEPVLPLIWRAEGRWMYATAEQEHICLANGAGSAADRLSAALYGVTLHERIIYISVSTSDADPNRYLPSRHFVINTSACMPPKWSRDVKSRSTLQRQRTRPGKKQRAEAKAAAADSSLGSQAGNYVAEPCGREQPDEPMLHPQQEARRPHQYQA